MSRLRYNGAQGILGAALTSGGTTITFAVAPSFATIVAPDVIAIVLEPGTANMEIVWLTAYTAAATTGTITRASEGTTGVAHAIGTVWSHDPTVVDFYPSSMKAAVVATSQTTASTTYTDLATVGPAVTVNTLTTAWVDLSGNLTNSNTANYVVMAFAVSGATTIAATDNLSITYFTSSASSQLQGGCGFLVTGLTPGANTFTCKYRVGAGGGTGTWSNRNIKVTPLDI